jgi:hypothetical protein
MVSQTTKIDMRLKLALPASEAFNVEATSSSSTSRNARSIASSTSA